MKCLEQVTFSKHWTGLSLFRITIKIIKVYSKSVTLLSVTTSPSLLLTKFTRDFARKMSVLTSLIRCDNTDLLPGWAAEKYLVYEEPAMAGQERSTPISIYVH